MEMEPELDPEALDQFRRGIEEFNAGKFFECHETLEDVWHGIRGSARDFFQGLIQISVGFYHLGNGNLKGGRSQLEKGLLRLERYPARFVGIDLERLRSRSADWLARVRDGKEIRCHVRDLPKIVLT
jgi:predicted metal-dependent hydrolase